MKKTFQSLIESKHKFLGSWLGSCSPEMVEILGIAGFDFIIIDTEHTAHGMESVPNLIRAAEVVETVPLVRVCELSGAAVKKALDAGAAGIIFPNISTPEEAEDAVRMTKFAPRGTRGACPCVRANSYGSGAFVPYYEQADRDTSVIILIENALACQNFDRILQVPGITSFYFGADDLSLSIGCKGDRYHPAVRSAIDEMLKKTKACGKCAGVWSSDPADARQWLSAGADYIMYGTDTGFALQKARESIVEIMA